MNAPTPTLVKALTMALVAVGLMAGIVTTAEAQAVTVTPQPTTTGPYVRLNTGYSFSTNRAIDESWIIGAGVGYRLNPNVRIEGAFDYRPDFNQTTNFGIGPGPKAGLQNWTLMANAYYDFAVPQFGPLVPYVGGGLGIARNSVDDVTVRVSDTGVSDLTGTSKNQFAWQAMAGISYAVNDRATLDVGYRYLDAGNAGFGDGTLKAHEITAAIRYGF